MKKGGTTSYSETHIMKMTSFSCRLLGFLFGICLLMSGFLVTYAEIQLELKNMRSWMDAFSKPPSQSHELISPFKALEVVPEIRNLTEGPIYVNGFTYEGIEEVVIQLSNITRLFFVYCRSASGGYKSLGGKYTYTDGKEQCQKENYSSFQNIRYQGVSDAFWNTEVWMESVNISHLFSENKTINCMLLDLSNGGQQLMLENCDNKHAAVYIQDDYKQTIKKYTSASSLPFYDSHKTSTGPTRTGTEITSKSTKSFENSSSIYPTRELNDSRTDKPDPEKPGTKGFKDKVQDIFGMNPDIFYALVGVGSAVLLIVIVCLCCCCKKKKGGTSRRLALSEDYSSPVDSVGMKDIEMNVNSSNGAYANPQDSISTVKAKKRHSIGEGVYDVTFTSGQRKPNANPNQHPVNAYDHVTIPPQGGIRTDETESHYDSTSHVKPQQKVFISSTHSDHTYGEVQLKPNT